MLPRQIINCSPSFSQMAKKKYMMSVDYGIMKCLRRWKTLLFLKMSKLKQGATLFIGMIILI